MISPSEFYRKLDEILASIATFPEKKDFIFSIMTKLESTFGPSLHFKNGHLYEEGASQFYLIANTIDAVKGTDLPSRLPFESEAVQCLMKHNCYIYDNPALTLIPALDNHQEYAIPAAIIIQGSDKRWLLVFELISGWIREEIEFCFNVVRRAIEFRLYATAFESNLKAAARIQQSLLPRNVPEIKGFQMAARLQPAELFGGDLFDFFDFDQEIFGVSIGDAVGHELPAALLVRDVVTGLRMGIEREMKITYAFHKLNKVIHRNIYSSAYVSLFYAEIEHHGSMFYVNAGHPAPLLVHPDGSQMLTATGPIIGPIPEIKVKRGYSLMQPGSVLVLYTDGIFERRSRLGENFSIERLQQITSENIDKSATDILNILFETAFEFGDNQPWEDDVTIVVIKRLIE